METKESTGRATCRKCFKTIEKGGYQVGEDTVDDYGQFSMRWHHASCYIELLEERVETAIRKLESVRKDLLEKYAKMGKTPWSK